MQKKWESAAALNINKPTVSVDKYLEECLQRLPAQLLIVVKMV